jgi:hypothetical protein
MIGKGQRETEIPLARQNKVRRRPYPVCAIHGSGLLLHTVSRGPALCSGVKGLDEIKFALDFLTFAVGVGTCIP